VSALLADFGPLVVATDVDAAVIATLQEWLPAYLGQVEVERGKTPGFLPRPALGSYANTLTSGEFLDHDLPALLVTTASASDPTVNADSCYRISWRLAISAIVRGRTAPETRETASLYEGSLRRVLVQKQMLGGLAGGVRWLTSSVAPVTDMTGAGRYLAAGMSTYTVFVDDVVREGGGPTTADGGPGTADGPYSPLATVVSVTTDVEATPITEDFT